MQEETRTKILKMLQFTPCVNCNLKTNTAAANYFSISAAISAKAPITKNMPQNFARAFTTLFFAFLMQKRISAFSRENNTIIVE